MIILLSTALVAAVPLAFVHGHAVATRTIKVKLRELMAVEEADRPPRRDPS